MKWLDLVPKPRPRPEPTGPFADLPIEWDVFVSYRSFNRAWAMALHDQLVEAGFKVFLDQFVIRPGLPLEQSLAKALESSASGVLVLSKEVVGSDWVDAERQKMKDLAKSRQKTRLPFHYVIARIDDAALPFRDADIVYADFSSGYEDGPRGAELIRLVHGLLGAPVAEQAVRSILKNDHQTSELLQEIAGAADRGDLQEIQKLAGSNDALASDTPVIAIRAAQALISARQPGVALEVISSARDRFPRSVRLQQLEGLAYRREGRIREAQKVLSKLYVAGHRDPETMGIYAATWMSRYRESGLRADLERSRSLYLDAFTTNPNDEYVGINAASKSAILGEIALAKKLAEQVIELVSKFADGSEFYKSLTLAEADVLLGNYDEAERIFGAVRHRYPAQHGDLITTIEQLGGLIEALSIPEAVAAKLRKAIGQGQ